MYWMASFGTAPSISAEPKRNSNAAAGNVAIGNMSDLPIFCKKANIHYPPLV